MLEEILSEKLSIEERIKKHVDFWNRTPGARPLVGREPEHKILGDYEWGYMPYPLKDGTFVEETTVITADMLSADHMSGVSHEGEEPFCNDRLSVLPPVRHAWLEAIVGCEIIADAHSFSSKAPKNLTPTERLYNFSVEKALNGPWFKLFEETMRQYAVKNPTYPMRQPQLRGVLDMLAGYLGESDLCYSIYDEEEQLTKLANQFVEVHNAVVDCNLKYRPLWHGGRASYWHIFVPGDCVDYQMDAAAMLSPDIYEEIFMPIDRKVIERYPYQVIHTHILTGRRHLPALMKIEKLKCIEIHIDRECNQFTFDMLKEAVDTVQKANKSVIIYGALLDEEVERILNSFEPEGLAVLFWQPRPEWLSI